MRPRIFSGERSNGDGSHLVTKRRNEAPDFFRGKNTMKKVCKIRYFIGFFRAGDF